MLLQSYEQIEQLGPSIQSTIARFGLDRDAGMVLSHKSVDAVKAAGAVLTQGQSQKQVLVFARAWKILRADESTPRARLNALIGVEKAVLALISGVDIDQGTPERLCSACSLDYRSLRTFALRLAVGISPRDLKAADYARELRVRIATFVSANNLQAENLSARIKAPTIADWESLKLSGEPSGLRWSTIHGVKGLEFAWITVVLPRNLQKDEQEKTMLDHWEEGSNSEARRVVYVGASRAEKLLIVAAHKNAIQRITAILTRDAVPFEECLP